MTGRRVAVAMSGGVDSSVAAALLAERGEQVFGLMLRLWGRLEGDNRCCSPEDVASARQVAQQLGIDFYVLDAQTPFKQHVVDFFVDGYAKGVTPNPCLECNRHVRWGFLLQHALALGATHLATGHYARLDIQHGRWTLLRARDREKDQSYVLSVLGQEELSHAVFPLGEMTKAEVRATASRLALSVADRRQSQDLCFVPAGDYRQFLRRLGAAPPAPGPIVDPNGRVLGRHNGLFDFTIGQRKGLGIPGPHPLYVLDKQVQTNTLVVGPRDALGRRTFRAGGAHWVSGIAPAGEFEALVRIRYKAREVPARVSVRPGDELAVETAEALPDVTPGQAAVFYHGDVCLGGAIILL
ncbi:MAG: tRNA 2-thiouridine(34) synthase MnmA [Chloroflexota bacterium]